MRGFWAVLRREIVERRLLLLAAALVGLVPLVVPFLPGVAASDSGEIRSGTALALCLAVSAVLVLTLGATVIGSDLVERRLGFYFARPIAGWAIWAGKLAGAAILSTSAALLVLLPALLLDPHVEIGASWWLDSAWIRDVPTLLVVLAGGSTAALLVVHAVSTMVRSRSSWLLLDLIGAFAVAALVWSERRILLRANADSASAWGIVGLLIALVVVSLLAGAVQVIRGRTDPRRGHRLLSLTFWSGMGLAALSFAVFAHWVLDVVPQDLVRIGNVLSPPAGTWVGLRGPVRGRGDYSPGFLMDTSSGRSFTIGSPPAYWWWLQPVFSPDGARAAWLERDSDGVDLKVLDLTRPDSQPAASRVSFDTWPARLALSAGGTRLAALVRSSLTVLDVATGRLLAAVPFPDADEEFFAMRFTPEGRLRIVERLRNSVVMTRARLTITELDPGHGRLSLLGSIELDETLDWTVRRDGERVAAGSRSLFRLFTTRTGEVLAELPLRGELAGMIFLDDGRLLLDERFPGEGVLHLLDADGRELRRFHFQATRVLLGGEVAPGRITLATRASPRASSYFTGWTAYLLDLDRGRATSLGTGLIPACRTAGSEGVGPRLFLKGRGELVLLDPATGRMRTVLRTR
jgi:hypothetical protein